MTAPGLKDVGELYIVRRNGKTFFTKDATDEEKEMNRKAQRKLTKELMNKSEMGEEWRSRP
jgi:hypothetical protein